MSAMPTVVHQPEAGRYVVEIDGHLSECDYELVDHRMVFTHTFVPPELRGRGVAELLVRTALAEARATGRKIVPACSYVESFVRRHREFQDLLA